MSDDALFDVFDQEEPTAIVELPKNGTGTEPKPTVINTNVTSGTMWELK